jgi:hypothetical protein
MVLSRARKVPRITLASLRAYWRSFRTEYHSNGILMV